MVDDCRLPRQPLVAVTSFYPNPSFPHRTVFVRNLIQAMRSRVEVEVVAPVPYAPPAVNVDRWRQLRAVPPAECADGINIDHPRYAAIPGLQPLSGLNYALGVRGTLRRRLQERGPFLVHAHCAWPDGVGAALAARSLGLPYVITAHGSDINVYAAKPLFRRQVRWAFRGARGVIAVSQALEAAIANIDAGMPLKRIPCAGYNPEVFALRSREACRAGLGVAGDAKLVLFVGNLVAVKAVDVLIDAWKRLPADKFQLVLIGDGVERAALKALASGLETVRFAGALPQSEVARWLGAADVLCLPSRNEGMPNVVVEALASGVPVVASRVGGIPDLVTDGVNGQLVAAGSPAELAVALRAALESRWDSAAIRASAADFTWRALADRNLSFFADLGL